MNTKWKGCNFKVHTAAATTLKINAKCFLRETWELTFLFLCLKPPLPKGLVRSCFPLSTDLPSGYFQAFNSPHLFLCVLQQHLVRWCMPLIPDPQKPETGGSESEASLDNRAGPCQTKGQKETGIEWMKEKRKKKKAPGDLAQWWVSPTYHWTWFPCTTIPKMCSHLLCGEEMRSWQLTTNT